MDKTVGKVLEMDGKPVMADAVFQTEKSDGTVDVIFAFNGSALGGHELVVFEKLYLEKDGNQIELTEHEDLEDEGQTVKIVKQERAPKTGDHSKIWLWLALSGVSAMGIAAVRIRVGRSKRNRRKRA